ncbi:MAG: hypothetical protein ACEPO8_09430 [Rhodothermaceae bacterium]
MFEIKRLDVSSIAKITAVLYFILGLVVMVPIIFLTLLTDRSISFSSGSIGAMLAVIIIVPVLYSIIGTVFSAVITAMYNYFAKSFGGIKLQLDKVEELVNNFAETSSVSETN